MKTFATLALLAILALPASAAVIYHEAVDGDLSSDPLTPTPLVFALGGNTVIGTCGNVGSPVDIRDYLRFSIPANHVLNGLTLLQYSPDNLSFASFNTGVTSVIPSGATNGFFLSGIHVTGSDLGSNLMQAFVTRAVTTNALDLPLLPAGDYCFLIQQTSVLTQAYALEFIVDAITPTDASTWGKLKNLYR